MQNEPPFIAVNRRPVPAGQRPLCDGDRAAVPERQPHGALMAAAPGAPDANGIGEKSAGTEAPPPDDLGGGAEGLA